MPRIAVHISTFRKCAHCCRVALLRICRCAELQMHRCAGAQIYIANGRQYLRLMIFLCSAAQRHWLGIDLSTARQTDDYPNSRSWNSRKAFRQNRRNELVASINAGVDDAVWFPIVISHNNCYQGWTRERVHREALFGGQFSKHKHGLSVKMGFFMGGLAMVSVYWMGVWGHRILVIYA